GAGRREAVARDRAGRAVQQHGIGRQRRRRVTDQAAEHEAERGAGNQQALHWKYSRIVVVQLQPASPSRGRFHESSMVRSRLYSVSWTLDWKPVLPSGDITMVATRPPVASVQQAA